MSSPLANKIAEIVDTAIHDPSGFSAWRGLLYDEVWKIVVDYDGVTEKFEIRVKRRDI